MPQQAFDLDAAFGTPAKPKTGPAAPVPASPQPQEQQKAFNLDAAFGAPAPVPASPKPTPPANQIQEPSLLGGFASEVKRKILHPVEAVKESFEPMVQPQTTADTTVVTPGEPQTQYYPGSPLYEAKKKGFEPENVGPYTRKITPTEQAVSETVSGLTSPANIGIMAGTMGLGGIASGAVAAAPKVATAAKVAGTAITAGFAGQQIGASGQAFQRYQSFSQEESELSKTYQQQLVAKSSGLLPPTVDPEHTRLMVDNARKQKEYWAAKAGISAGFGALATAGAFKEGESLTAPKPGANVGAAEAEAKAMSREAEAATAQQAAQFGEAEQQKARQATYEAAPKPNPSNPNDPTNSRVRYQQAPGQPAYTTAGQNIGGGAPDVPPVEPPIVPTTEHPQQLAVTHVENAAKESGRQVTREIVHPDGTIEREYAAPVAPAQPEPQQQTLAPAQQQTLAAPPEQKALPPSPRYVEPKVEQSYVDLANEYNRGAGLPETKHEPFEVDETLSQDIADFYDKAESKPNDPEVQAAYTKFNEETHNQFEFLKSKGFTFEPVDDPVTYKNNEELRADLTQKKLKVWTGGSPEHTLITPEQNFEFRAVHDMMGHGLPGADFGHGGEESAYRSHLQMYSPEAQKAMATETRGQNAAVTFSRELNNPPETRYTDEGTGGVNLKFPTQKATILPEHLRATKGPQSFDVEKAFAPSELNRPAIEPSKFETQMLRKPVGGGSKDDRKNVGLMSKADLRKYRNYWEPRGHQISAEKVYGKDVFHVYDTPPKPTQKKSATPLETSFATGAGGVGAGMDRRMFRVLARNMYKSGNVGKVISKELLQNSIDAVRTRGSGKINLSYDGQTRTFNITDDGTGMLPQTVTKEFIDVGGSLKPEGATGGFGIAKVVIFADAEEIFLETVAKNGSGHLLRTRLEGSGDDWIDSKMRVSTEKVPAGTPTGSKLQVKLNQDVPIHAGGVREYLKNFKESHSLPFDFKFDVKDEYSSESAPVEGAEVPPVRKVATKELPGGTIEFHVSEESTKTDKIPLHVMNNGVPQFITNKYGEKANYPKRVVINIKPSVTPESDQYPFNVDREGTKDAVSAVISEWVRKQLIENAAAAKTEKYKFTLNKAATMKNGYRVVDTNESVPPELVDEIASDGAMNVFVKEVGRAHDAFKEALQKFYSSYGTAEFMGIGLGAKYLGVNIKGEGLGTENNKILFNPFTQMQEVDNLLNYGYIEEADVPRVFAEQTMATLVHELAHQAERSHDDKFAGTLDRSMGHSSRLFVQLAADLEKVLKNGQNWALRAINRHKEKLASLPAGENIFGEISSNASAAAPGGRGAGVVRATRGQTERRGPSEAVQNRPGGSAEGLAPVEPAGSEQHLTPDEREGGGFDEIQGFFDELPNDFTTAAKLGSLGRFWYENSARALKNYFGDDAPQFTKLLAAYSPRQLVKDNLKTALDAWNEWEDAGRPSDDATIEKILENHAGGKAFAGRFNNAVRTLRGDVDPFSDSSQKVSSFYQNLIGNVNYVTNDVWMAKFADIAHSVLGTRYGYLGLSAKVRQAARELGWSPQQVQSGVWVFTKALWELGVKGLPVKDVVNHLNLKDASDLTDFATIFAKDQDVRTKLAKILERQGGSLEALESTFTAADKPKRGAKERVDPEAARSLAGRLEPGILKARAEQRRGRFEKREERSRAVGQESLFGSAEPRSKMEEQVLKRGGFKGGSDIFAKLIHPDVGNEVSLDSLRRGFIDSTGKGVNTIKDHADALAEVGALPTSMPNVDMFANSLAENKLVRFVRINGFGNKEIAIATGTRPTGGQMSAIRHISDLNPQHSLVYDLYKDGKRVKSAGNVDFKQFNRDVNLTYRAGEAGMFRPFARKKSRPVTPNSAEYDKVYKDQEKAKEAGAGLTLGERLSAAQVAAVNRYLDKFVYLRNAVEESKARNAAPAAEDNPYIQAQLSYGGGMGNAEAHLIEGNRIQAALDKVGLLDEARKYLNLRGYESGRDLLLRKEAQARAAGNTAEANAINSKIVNNEDLPAGYTIAKILQDQADQSLALGATRFAELERLIKPWYELSKQAWDAAYDEGLISNAEWQAGLSRGDKYINLRRILDDMKARGLGAKSLGVRRRQSVKSYAGSERTNIDPFVADPQHWTDIYREVGKNRPVRAWHEFAKQDPQGWGVLTKEKKPGMRLRSDEGTVAYYKDGKPIELIVPKEIADAFGLASEQESKIFGLTMLSLGQRIYRNVNTTGNLGFAVPNVIKDATDTMVFSMDHPFDVKTAAKFGVELGKAIKSIVSKDKGYLDFLRSGAAYSTLQKYIDPSFTVPGFSKFNVFKDVAMLNNVLEEMTKVATYNMMLNQGMSKTEAAAFTRKWAGTPDVLNSGSYGKQLGALIPFINSGLKGLEREWHFVKGQDIKNGRYKAAAMIGAVIAAALLAHRWNQQFLNSGMDPETGEQLGDGRPEWDHITDNDKARYAVILLPQTYPTSEGGIRHYGIKIPVSHFVGSIWNPIMAALDDATRGNVEPQRWLDALGNLLPGNVNVSKDAPVGSAVTSAVGSINPFLQEPLEQLANKEMTGGRPIVPERMAQVEGRYQADERTSPTARVIADSLNKALGTTDVSPIRIEHSLRDLFGGLGESVTTALDKAFKQDKQKLEPRGQEKYTRWPVLGPAIRRFMPSAADQVRVEGEKNFYKLFTDAQAKTRTLNFAVKQDAYRQKVVDEFVAHPEKIAYAEALPTLTEIAQGLTAIRDAVSNVAALSMLDNTEKRAKIQRLQKVYNALLNTHKVIASAAERIKNAPDAEKRQRILAVLDR